MADYLHPYVGSKIIDNSQVFLTANGTTWLFAAFKADQGPDNRIVPVTTTSEFDFYYGDSVFKRHGQQHLNVRNWLEAGGTAYCMRVLPYSLEDADKNAIQPATYAARILEVGLKAKTSPATGYDIKIRTRALGDGKNTNVSADVEKLVRDDESLRKISLATVKTADAAETDGFKYYPIAVFRAASRGVYGSNFGIQIELNTALDDTYDFRLYDFTIYTSASRAAQTISAAFYPEAMSTAGAPLDLESVFANDTSYMRALFNEDNWDVVVAAINSDPTLAKKVDCLFLEERNVHGAVETVHASAALDEDSEVLSTTLNPYKALGGGVDGDWVDESSYETLLYKAYTGTGDTIDPLTGNNVDDTYFSDVLDTDRYEIDMTLDANYNYVVKNAMATAAANRGDYMTLLDLGFPKSYTQAIKSREASLTINTFYAAIYGQYFVVKDANSVQMTVTPTYFLASKIPANDIAYGMQVALAGLDYGSISGFESCSYFPNEPAKEALYKARVNYVEQDTLGVRFGTHKTSQYIESALSAIPNVRSLLRLRRELHKFGKQKQYKFNMDTVWSDATTELNELLSAKVNANVFKTASGTVYASDRDRQENIMRLQTAVTYHGFVERVLIEMQVNK